MKPWTFTSKSFVKYPPAPITILKALSELISAPHAPWRTNRDVRSLWIWRGTVRLEHNHSSNDNQPALKAHQGEFLPCPRMLHVLLLPFSVPEEGKENGNCYRKRCRLGLSEGDSWHIFCAMLSSRCLCLHRLFCISSMTVCSWEGLRRAGRKAKTPSVRALFGLLCSCPEKVWFARGASCCWKLRKPKHEWDQRNCTSPWLAAHEWLLNDVSDRTWTQRFLAVGRTTGRTVMLVLLSRLFPRVGYFLLLLLDFILGPDKTLKARGREKAATQNKLQCVWIGEWELKRKQGVLPDQDRWSEGSIFLAQHQWERVTINMWQGKHVQDLRREHKDF